MRSECIDGGTNKRFCLALFLYENVVRQRFGCDCQTGSGSAGIYYGIGDEILPFQIERIYIVNKASFCNVLKFTYIAQLKMNYSPFYTA